MDGHATKWGVFNAHFRGAFTGRLELIAHEMFGPGLGGSLGATAGGAVFGHVGAFIGATTGAAVGKAVQAAREAGLKNVDQLVSQALLNPALMKTLLSKATPANSSFLMDTLAGQLRPLALVTAARGPDQEQEPRRRAALPQRALNTPPPNALAGLAPPSRFVPTSSNALLR